MLSREVTGVNFSVFDLTPSGIKHDRLREKGTPPPLPSSRVFIDTNETLNYTFRL